MAPVVVKLGGSHADAPALRGAWLRALAAADGPVVLVPGGGPFADAVRVQQAAMGYGDAVAHDMALLAMGQYGLVLAAAAGFAAAGSEARIAAVLARGQVAVWMPAAMLARARGVEKGWGVTSDSLALWLGARLGARAVVLVKRDAGAPGLDAAFGGFLAGFGGEVRVAGPGDVPGRLEVGALPGRVLRRALAGVGLGRRAGAGRATGGQAGAA